MSTNTKGKIGCGGYFAVYGTTIVFTTTLVILIGFFVQSASLLWSGLPAQGTIVVAKPVTCGSKQTHPGFNYTVQFTDRAGQSHLATLHGCDVTVPSTPSFTIIYLANDPTTIDLPSAAPMRFWLALGLIVFTFLCDLPFLAISIGLLRRAWFPNSSKEQRHAAEKPVASSL